MTGWLARWRLALRIARRDALRHRGRSLLVLAMVGLPILAVVGADTLYRTSQVTPVEALPGTLGHADARLVGEAHDRIWADPATGDLWSTSALGKGAPWTAAQVAAQLPDGSRLVESVHGRLTYRTEFGYARVTGYAEDADDPMLRGRFTVLDGRLPAATGEVAVGRRVAERGIGVGDQLALTRDDVPARVVGVVRAEAGPSVPFLLLDSSAAHLLAGPSSTFYATVPGGLDCAAVRALNTTGLSVLSREVALDPPPQEAWLPPGDQFGPVTDPAAIAVMSLIVAAVVLEVVLLTGPAFAVGVRRQRRELALLAATGGAPRDLRRTVLASGIVLGGGAALLGAGLGIGLAALAVPLVERWSDVQFGPLDVSLRDALLAVAVGVLAGLAAAYFPARQAGRTDIVTALAGRRGQVRTSWRFPVLGLVLAAAGVVAVVAGTRGSELGVAGGAVLLVAGAVVAAPWLVRLLTPLARWLPTAGRLAVRDATRNRSRTAPALAAVMATVAGVTALAIGSASDSAQARRDYVPSALTGTGVLSGAIGEASWNDVIAVLQRVAPQRPVYRVRSVPSSGGTQRDMFVVTPDCTGKPADCQWFPSGAGQGVAIASMIVADAPAAHLLGDGALPPDAFAGLDAGRVVVFGDGALDARNEVTVAEVEYRTDGTPRLLGTARLPAVQVPLPRGRQHGLLPGTVVPPSLADRLPVPVQTTSVVTGGPDDPVTAAQEERINETLTALDAPQMRVERGFTDRLSIARLVLILLGALLVLIATLTATGLALADARPDFATLAAVGAAPRTRRFIAMGSSAVVAGAGAVLGLLVGLGPGIAVAVPLTSTNYGNGAHPILDIPWTLLAGITVAVPLLAVAVTGLFVRSRLPMTTRIT